VVPHLYRSHRYELAFSGTLVDDALTHLAADVVHRHPERTVISSTLDASALAGLLKRAQQLELKPLSLRIVV
jgi:hypothetical protein